jgi:hypothetical protein
VSTIVAHMEDAMSLPSDRINRRLSHVPVVMTLTLGRTTMAADVAETSSPVRLSFAELIRLTADATARTDD